MSGIDYDALKNWKPGGGGGGAQWLKMRPSETGNDKRYTIRLIPTKDNSIFFDTQIHYLGTQGNKTIGECPRVEGGKCSACEMYFNLIKKVTTKQHKEILRNIAPQTRIFVNAVLRAVDKDMVPDEMQEAQVWSLTYRVGMMLKDEILLAREEGMDLLDRETGHDLVAKVVAMGSSYKVDTISVKHKATSVREDIEPLDLESLARQKILSTEEVAAAVQPSLGGYFGVLYDAFGEELPGVGVTPATEPGGLLDE